MVPIRRECRCGSLGSSILHFTLGRSKFARVSPASKICENGQMRSIDGTALTAQESIQATNFVSKSVSSFHKISLKSQWKSDAVGEVKSPCKPTVRFYRAFHRPTGLAENQVVRFCFATESVDVQFWLNGSQTPLSVIKGLASVPITSMMEPVNRVEIQWRNDPSTALPLPEHFEAWLEISDESPIP